MHVIRIPPERLDALQQALVDRAGRHVEPSGDHERFRIEMGRWPVVAYDSGKVTIEDEDVMPVIEDVLDEVLDTQDATVVGSDEAGKGEWLGPLAVAACAVPPQARTRLVARGVMDSKELGSQRLLEAADVVEGELDHHAVVLVSPPRFNELFAEFKQEGKSLNDLVAWAHARALGEVLQELEAADRADDVRILVDEFDRVATQARAQRAFDVERYPVEQRVQAEEEIAVAAASVLAKAAVERWIDRYEDEAGRPIRSLTMEEARADSQATEYAKTSYIEE